MDTYKIKFECPECGEDLTFDKKKNRGSVHHARCISYFSHVEAGECSTRDYEKHPVKKAN